jgi:hypothetical protein
MDIPAQGDEIRLPDGRVTLAHPERDLDPRYTNGDLAPVPIERRTWTTYNYAALWIGMSHNIPSYLLASGLIAVGFNWVQAIILIALANLIVLIPMLLNSHAGTKYGIPFPVFARASFGLRGANLAALLRAVIACGWFGIQTWIGGEAIYTPPPARPFASAAPKRSASSPRRRRRSPGWPSRAAPTPRSARSCSSAPAPSNGTCARSSPSSASAPAAS